MKYNGQAIARQTKNIVVGGFEFKISTLPVGYIREFDKLWPIVEPPVKVTESVKEGRKEVEQFNDPKFLTEYSERAYHKAIYSVYLLLRNDERIQFENTPTSIESMKALAKEFSESGISDGDILELVKVTQNFDYISAKEIEKSDKVF